MLNDDKQNRFNALMTQHTELSSDYCMVDSDKQQRSEIQSQIDAIERELEGFGISFNRAVCLDNLASKSIRFNTVAHICSQRDKPIMFHVSLCVFSGRERYSLYFTYDDVNFDYVQTGKGRRKLYLTLDEAYQDVYRIDPENGVLLVTRQHFFEVA